MYHAWYIFASYFIHRCVYKEKNRWHYTEGLTVLLLLYPSGRAGEFDNDNLLNASLNHQSLSFFSSFDMRYPIGRLYNLGVSAISGGGGGGRGGSYSQKNCVGYSFPAPKFDNFTIFQT